MFLSFTSILTAPKSVYVAAAKADKRPTITLRSVKAASK